MPLFTQPENQVLPQDISKAHDPLTTVDFTWEENIKAAFETGAVGSLARYAADELDIHLKQQQPQFARIDDDFDVWDYVERNNLQMYASNFKEVENRFEADAIAGRIKDENQNNEIIASSGLKGIAASLVTETINPINWMGFGAGGAALRGGGIARGAAIGTGAGAAASISNEAILQATQETITLGDSAEAVAMEAVIGGMIGGGVAAFMKRSDAKRFDQIKQQVADDFNGVEPNDGSVGAAMVAPETTLDDEGVSSALGAEKAFSFQDPVLRASVSQSKSHRIFVQDLAESPLARKKNEKGIASGIPVENAAKQYDAFLGTALAGMDGVYVKYRGARKSLTMLSDSITGKARRDGKLTWNEFSEQVAHALRNGDKHEIPEVQEAAQIMRKELYDPMLKAAQEVGLLPLDLDPKTAQTYLNRLYDHSLIAARRQDFNEIHITHLKEEFAQNIEKLDVLEVELQDLKLKEATPQTKIKIKELEGDIAKLQAKTNIASDAEFYDIAEQITDRIMGTPVGRLPYDGDNISAGGGGNSKREDVRGALKERSYLIDDNKIAPFLINNVEQLASTMVRTMAIDIELKRKFGTLDFTEHYKNIALEYNEVIKKAKTEKEKVKLQRQKESDIRDAKAIIERLRGTYAQPDDYASFKSRGIRVSKQLNYVRLLGGMTVSAIPDLAKPVMEYGFGRVYNVAFKGLIQNKDAFIRAAQEVKDAGTAWDMELHTRAKASTDVDHYVDRSSKVETALDNLATKMGTLSLMDPWNASMKRVSGVLTQSLALDHINTLATGGKLKPKDRTRLASLFIDEPMAKRIDAQFKKHGETEGTIKVANAKLWDDKEAQRAFRAAIRKSVDQTIITPGQDKPLMMSSEVGSLIFQFKSFAFASMQRTLLTGLQRRDMETLNGMMLMVGLGSMTYALKNAMADREISDDPAVWIKEGIDRSGITGWLFEANNIVEKVTRGNFGANRLVGGEIASRYASRSVTDSLLGPSLGMVQNMAEVMGSVANGEWSERDTRQLRRLMPYQNLIGLRHILDQAETNINSSLGVPKN